MKLTVGSNTIDITRELALSAGKGWREMLITEACAPGLGRSIAIASEGPLTMQISAVAREVLPDGADCSF